jgi:hypothetical protein
MRRGWENEHLARFILSKFAFCANPVTIADDLGSDLFCCLFKARRQDGHDVVVPLNSLAIQIKSSRRPIDVTNKITYLAELEMPFFVGIVNRSKLQLTVYSGEYLPFFFGLRGNPERLQLRLIDNDVGVEQCHQQLAPGAYRILFPLVAQISASPSEAVGATDEIYRRCELTHRNIAARRSQEHVYIFPSGEVRILAGPGSFQHFRENLCLRLAEAIYNVKWVSEQDPQRFVASEARLYMSFFEQVKAQGIPIPPILEMVQKQLSQVLAGVAPGSF